jgi:hypothetical protein
MSEFEGKYPKLAKGMTEMKYMLQVKAGDAGAKATGAKLVDGLITKKDSQGLNAFAWGIVDPEGDMEKGKRDYDLAMKAAEAAVKQELAAIRNRLAALEGRKGNAGEAITDEEGSKLPQRFDPIGASPPSKAERREPTTPIPAKLRAILGPDWKAIRRHYSKTKSIKQTAANFDVPINTLKARIRREGWSK